jgi:hypothetical protein
MKEQVILRILAQESPKSELGFAKIRQKEVPGTFLQFLESG